MEIKNKTYLIFISLLLLGGMTLFIFFLWGQKPRVSQTTPADKERNISLFTEISLQFQKEVSEKDKGGISFTLSGDIRTTSNWQDKKILKIIPHPYLTENTQYQLNVYYKDTLLKTITFTTALPDTISDEDQQKQQTIDDYQYAKGLEDERKEKPWLDLLPIDNEQFVAVYDYETQKLRIHIIQKGQEGQLDKLKSDIKTQIAALGIPSSLPIDWVIEEQ